MEDLDKCHGGKCFVKADCDLYKKYIEEGRSGTRAHFNTPYKASLNGFICDQYKKGDKTGIHATINIVN